jgi:hypothetical protein
MTTSPLSDILPKISPDGKPYKLNFVLASLKYLYPDADVSKQTLTQFATAQSEVREPHIPVIDFTSDRKDTLRIVRVGERILENTARTATENETVFLTFVDAQLTEGHFDVLHDLAATLFEKHPTLAAAIVQKLYNEVQA